MLDRDQLKRKVILELLGNPVTLYPFVLGVAGLMAAFALPIDAAVPAFVGVAGLVGSAGSLALRFLYRRDQILERAAAEMEQEAAAGHKRSLEQLHRQLEHDGDPRTEKLFQDLLALTEMARDDQTWPDISVNLKFDILAGVEKLFDSGVERLRLTLTLYQRAQRLTLPQARKPIEAQRELLIAQVGKGIEELSRILTEVQAIGVQQVDESDLRRILGDLERSVEAERETRQNLDREIELLEAHRQAEATRQRT